jgi:hypothetical protein
LLAGFDRVKLLKMLFTGIGGIVHSPLSFRFFPARVFSRWRFSVKPSYGILVAMREF